MSANPHAEIHIDHMSSDLLREWALAVTAIGGSAIELVATDMQFMGVELTLRAHGASLFTLALFASTPNEREKEIMEVDGVEVGGL